MLVQAGPCCNAHIGKCEIGAGVVEHALSSMSGQPGLAASPSMIYSHQLLGRLQVLGASRQGGRRLGEAHLRVH